MLGPDTNKEELFGMCKSETALIAVVKFKILRGSRAKSRTAILAVRSADFGLSLQGPDWKNCIGYSLREMRGAGELVGVQVSLSQERVTLTGRK